MFASAAGHKAFAAWMSKNVGSELHHNPPLWPNRSKIFMSNLVQVDIFRPHRFALEVDSHAELSSHNAHQNRFYNLHLDYGSGRSNRTGSEHR